MKVTKQHKFLIIVLLLGGGLVGVDRLFVLEKGVAPEVAAAPAAAVAMPPSHPAQAAKPPAERIAQRLARAGSQYAQIPFQDLFSAGPGWVEPVIEQVPDKGIAPGTFARLHRLTGVLTSPSNSYAMVNGKIVTIGQVIGGHRLVSVSHRSATFQSEASEPIVLTMDPPTAIAGVDP